MGEIVELADTGKRVARGRQRENEEVRQLRRREEQRQQQLTVERQRRQETVIPVFGPQHPMAR